MRCSKSQGMCLKSPPPVVWFTGGTDWWYFTSYCQCSYLKRVITCCLELRTLVISSEVLNFMFNSAVLFHLYRDVRTGGTSRKRQGPWSSPATARTNCEASGRRAGPSTYKAMSPARFSTTIKTQTSSNTTAAGERLLNLTCHCSVWKKFMYELIFFYKDSFWLSYPIL